MSVFEALMMVCFGFAWPFSIYKSYKSRSNNGKSLLFLLIVLLGYMSGIVHKIFYNYDYVIFFYTVNFILVFIDVCLYYRNYKIVKNQAI